jgi:uncharacterized membrane protein
LIGGAVGTLYCPVIGTAIGAAIGGALGNQMRNDRLKKSKRQQHNPDFAPLVDEDNDNEYF